jgi:hypothetical protein
VKLTIKVFETKGAKVAACLGIAVAIIFGVLNLPPVKDKLWVRHPDIYVCAYGMDNSSYTFDQLSGQGPMRYKITIIPIQFPEGVSSIENIDVPLWFFNWTYSDDEKLYIVTAQNKGDGVARNTEIDIDFAPNSIASVNITNEERVRIIQGGEPTGTRAVFEIPELLPRERQHVEILIQGKSIKSLDAWSESEGTIKNVFIQDIVIEPDNDFVK